VLLGIYFSSAISTMAKKAKFRPKDIFLDIEYAPLSTPVVGCAITRTIPLWVLKTTYRSECVDVLSDCKLAQALNFNRCNTFGGSVTQGYVTYS
jgi:hypothetical protein